MTRFLRAGVIAVLGAGAGFAAPCANGTLASYIALGSTGCTIGTLLVKDFAYIPGGSNRTAAEVNVYVTPNALFHDGQTTYTPAVGLGFSTFPESWNVQSRRIAASVTPSISYSVIATGPRVRGFELTMGGADFNYPTGFGFVTVNAQVCLNGALPACSLGSFRTLTTFYLSTGLTQSFVPVFFTGIGAAEVTNHINLSAYAFARTSFPNTIQNIFLLND